MSLFSLIRHSRQHYALRTRFYTRGYYSHPRPIPIKLPEGYDSLLPLVLSCNNLDITKFPDPQYLVTTRSKNSNNTAPETVVPFFLSNSEGPQQPLGFLRPAVAKALEDYQKQELDSPFDLEYATGPSGRQLMSVAFTKTVNDGGNVVRTRRIGVVVEEWKGKNPFRDIPLGESL